MDDDQEEFYCCREQEGMDDWVANRAAVRTEKLRTQRAEVEVKVQKSRGSSIQQSEDMLDKEIEFMRKLMVKVSQRKTTRREQRSRSSSRRKIERECKSAASGAR